MRAAIDPYEWSGKLLTSCLPTANGRPHHACDGKLRAPEHVDVLSLPPDAPAPQPAEHLLTVLHSPLCRQPQMCVGVVSNMAVLY